MIARRQAWGVAAIVALACAFAWPMQGRSLGELSNYAMVKSLASGTATIDETRYQVGDVPAGDFRTYEGHVYSDKAPGLAFATVPAYVVLRELGLRTTGDPTVALWALRLWGVVLPGVLLLFIARGLAERIAPGHGTAAAVALGAGTLVLPFATLFYSHVLTATLLLGSFALLWHDRGARPRLWRPAAAGLLAGLSVTSEYQTAIVAAGLGVYALLRSPRVPRALAYGAGLAAGIAPLLAYNHWAFGSMTHLSYFGRLPGGDDLSSGGLANLLDPSLVNVLFTYVSMPGLLVLAPVLACGILGVALLYARGWRAEALTIALVTTAFTAYNASLPGIEYDAYLAGPRYLVPLLPLLAVPIALAFGRWPTTTATLGLVSTILLGVLTASNLHASIDRRWFHSLAEREFSQTAASVVGVTGWYAIVPFFLALAAALVCAALATRPARSSTWEIALAGLAVATWAAAAAAAPSELTGGATQLSSYGPVLLVLLAFAAVVVTARAVARRSVVPEIRSGPLRPL